MDSHNLHLLSLSIIVTVLCLRPIYASLSTDFTVNTADTGASSNNDNNNNSNNNQMSSWLNKFDSSGKALGVMSNSGHNFPVDDYLRKRSAAFGRAHFRPGKRTVNNFNSMEDAEHNRRRPLALFSSQKELPISDYINMDPYLRMALKRSVTTGRAHFRPAKRLSNCLTSAEDDYAI